MGGSSSSQTQTTKTMPPSWALGNLTQAAADSRDLYNRSKNDTIYQGQRVTDLSNPTTSAIGGLGNVAGNYTNPYLNGLATNPTSSASNLQGIASGNFIGNNQYYQNALQNTLNNVANTINSQFSGAGRYGSGAHSGVLANKLGQVATEALSNQYNRDVANNLAANAQIDQSNYNQLAGARNFYGGASDAYLNQLRGGTVLDENAQNKLNAAMQAFLEQRNLPHENLAKYLAETGATANGYGTSTSTTTSKQGGNFGRVLGGVLGMVTGLGQGFGL